MAPIRKERFRERSRGYDAPRQDRGGERKQAPERLAEPPVVAAVELDHPQEQQPGRAEQDVAELCPRRLPRVPRALQGQRNRDTHDEQEEREDDVGQRHPIGVRGLNVVHPGRCRRAEIVDEDHQQDRQSAEHIHGSDATCDFRRGGNRAAFTTHF